MSNQVKRVISREFTVTAVAAGTQVGGILGGKSHRGYIRQVIARASTAGGTSVDLELRLVAASDLAENLIYQNNTASYPLIDLVNAPFDTYIGDGDLTLYVEPQADGVIEIRIDFEILE
tara:strand:- start:570 stop:926 length:357 start_codon:yes stop_codon:yes gene_type:complete